jgi:phosphatidylglycerophosphate synthase
MKEDEVFLSLLPVFIFNGVLLLCFIIFIFIYRRRPMDESVPELKHKSFVGEFLRQFGYWFTNPLTWIFIKLRFTPNTLTISSLFLACLSACYYYKGSFAAAGWILIASGALDGLDGRLARATGQVTRSGAYLDSTLDRYCDGILLAGLAMYFRDDPLMLIITILTIIGSEVVSYSKSRGESFGVNTNAGLMQRPERLVLLGLTSIFHPFIMVILSRYNITAAYPMIIIMILMCILTNYTAAVRIITVFREIKKKSDAG